ncbi:rRNA maturation RNase YbeY [Candidatus Jorgensenbacteria bacterium]|nr:rRNA maturation RNase YbeY [Candidatus Jorgensenbacteria bacterium]
MNQVVVLSSSRRFNKLERELKSVITSALIYLRRSSAYVEIYLVSDIMMKSLNSRFRGRRRVTNVLSFNMNKDFFNSPPKVLHKHLGEIYLTPDYIRNRHEDLGYLAIHGLLHLLGYAHNKKRDRIKMESLESGILRRLRRFNRKA